MEVLSTYKAEPNCFTICARLMPFGYIYLIRGTKLPLINTVRNRRYLYGKLTGVEIKGVQWQIEPEYTLTRAAVSHFKSKSFDANRHTFMLHSNA